MINRCIAFKHSDGTPERMDGMQSAHAGAAIDSARFIATHSTARSSGFFNGNSASRASTEKTMPTSSPKNRADAKPAARDKNGRFRTNTRANACSIARTNRTPNKAHQKPVHSRESTAPPSKEKAPHKRPRPLMRKSAFPKKGIERPRVRMSDALRQEGMDEIAIARGYAAALNKLAVSAIVAKR